jgi:hypothetical protein
MTTTVVVHGHNVTYEENAHGGMRYLRDDLSSTEAQVLFSQAKEHQSAQFEDDQDREFTLIHNSGGGYTVVRR